MFWKSIFGEKPTPVCVGCVFSHVEVGYEKSEERIFCSFGGGLRALPFAVSACSDFRDKRAPAGARVVSGFARAQDMELTPGVVAKK